jgi:cytochrome b561
MTYICVLRLSDEDKFEETKRFVFLSLYRLAINIALSDLLTLTTSGQPFGFFKLVFI